MCVTHALHVSLSPPVTQSDLASLYIKAGVKNIGTVFLMTDAQVADDKFLVLVNDLLASGNSRRHLLPHVMFSKREVLLLCLSNKSLRCHLYSITHQLQQIIVKNCKQGCDSHLDLYSTFKGYTQHYEL